MERFTLHDPGHQAHVERFFRTDPPAGEDQLLGPGHPDRARQELRCAATWNDAHADLWQAEGGVLGRDDQVARQGQLEPTAQRMAEDGGNGWLGHSSQ